MAAQKKKSAKSATSSKSKSSVPENNDSCFGVVVGGWFLFAVGCMLLLGCVTGVYSGASHNWLGPYFGGLFPHVVTLVFGKVSVIFFTIALVLWGLLIALSSLRVKLLRFAIGFSLLVLNVSFFMALKNYGVAHVSDEILSMNGGVIGQFLVQNVSIPVFGMESKFASLIISLVAFCLILVLSFGLRPRHFRFIGQTANYLSNLISSREKTAEVVDAEPVELSVESNRRRRGVVMDDETMIFVPNESKMRRKGKVVPFNGRRNWLDEQEVFIEPDEAPTQVIEKPRIEKSRNIPEMDSVRDFDAPTIVDAPVPAVPEFDYGNEVGDDRDPEIRRLEEELRLNEHRMNALQILEIKERIAALRRARDFIDWEKGRPGRMQVKGDVRRSESSAVESVQDVPTESSETQADKGEQNETLVATRAATAKKSRAKAEPKSASRKADASAVRVSAKTAASLVAASASAAEQDDAPTSFHYEAPEEVDEPENTLEENDFEPIPERSGMPEGSAAAIPHPDSTAAFDKYKIPSIEDILDTHEVQTADYTEEELNDIGKMLEEKLENFKVRGRVIGCETGPMITRFEVEPGPGVKVSRFSALQEDLALPLRVSSVRILAPIPGKAAVGIEIPNRKFQTVFCRDVFMSEHFKPSPEKILVALGKDITGEAFTMDLAKAPHLLIAGQTGSGKSVCINALMASILFSKTPDELRMILVDPKAVELKMYENIPHLLAPVITKPEIAIQALQWLCYEMDRRTEVLAMAKVRNIGGFNAKFDANELPDEVPEEDRGHRMAFIVVIIDEMADLMMVAGKEIEKSVARLAAKARAVGIHLVLATQRPSVKVITGIIKANLPTRISFKVASQIDARTVMDHAGAEKLLGRGDMLFKAVNAPDPERVHGAFLSDEEAEKLADACSNQNVCYPQVESFDITGGDDEDGEEGGNLKNEKLDKLLFEVAEWAISVNGLSTSAVQRHFSVGYSRAGKIVDQLYGLGVCGPSKGNSKPRAMLVDMDGLMNLERSGKFG